MLIQAVTSYFHYIAMISLFIALVLERRMLQEVMNLQDVRKISVVDLVYGISAVLVVGTGLLRLFIYGKGVEYYLQNPIFHLKLTLFVVVALLSVYPTVTFLKLRKSASDEVVIPKYRLISRLVHLELILLALVPLTAALMANGIGLD